MPSIRLVTSLLAVSALCACAQDPGRCEAPKNPTAVPPTAADLLARVRQAGFDLNAVRSDGTVVIVLHDFCRPPIQPSLLEEQAKVALASTGEAPCDKPPIVIANACASKSDFKR